MSNQKFQSLKRFAQLSEEVSGKLKGGYGGVGPTRRNTWTPTNVQTQPSGAIDPIGVDVLGDTD